jgi:hypothetical protein
MFKLHELFFNGVKRIEKGKYKKWVPYSWQLVSSLCFLAMTHLIKTLKQFSPFRLLYLRSLFTLMYAFPLLKSENEKIYVKDKNI